MNLRTLRRAISAAAAVLALATVAGCGASSSTEAPSNSTSGLVNGMYGNILDKPLVKPAMTLTDTAGQPYNMAAQTAGRVALLYFGYTHCPDICPTTMADIAVALQQVAVLQSKVDVVFVTTDPYRDTPAVIKAWLAHYNANFIGLTGSEDTIYNAAGSLHILMDKPKPNQTGDYTVSHAAEVVAFSPDGQGRVAYTAGTSSQDYAHDLIQIADNKVK
jgi:protein SCO1/2